VVKMPEKVVLFVKKDNVIQRFEGEQSPDMTHVIIDAGNRQKLSWAITSPSDIDRLTGKRVYYAWAESPYTLRWLSYNEWEKLTKDIIAKGHNGGNETKLPVGFFQMTKDRRVVDLIADRKVMPNIFGQVRILSKTELFGLISIGALLWIVARIVAKAAFGVVLP